MKLVRYEHHGREVSVMFHLKGKHREHCLCYAGCQKFKPGQSDNCRIAHELFKNCVLFGVVTPVFECPSYEEPPMKFVPVMRDVFIDAYPMFWPEEYYVMNDTNNLDESKGFRPLQVGGHFVAGYGYPIFKKIPA